jgi:CBS domain-containing protein
MLVSDILKGKGRDVVTTSAEKTLGQIVTLLSDRRIGALVVLGASGTIEGIISERDIVHAIARDGGKALERPVSENMTRRVVSCRQTDTVHSLMERMTQHRFRHVPVLDGDALIGIVSIGDVVKHRLMDYETETQAMREYITHA